MGWFRSNVGKVAWLACFALACQFALTFGHVHLGRTGSASAAVVVSLDPASHTADNDVPARQRAPDLGKDLCAICKNISLAGMLVLPVSPAAGAPVSFIHDPRWPVTAIRLTLRRHSHFSARGPPVDDPPA